MTSADMSADRLKNRIFYSLKPMIPRKLQLFMRRRIAQHKRKKFAHIWPIDPNSAEPPKGWLGWPYGKQFSLVLSHDVDTDKGYGNVLKLADLEEEMGFRSQFNFVPERYGKVEIRLLEELKRRGFGIGVHGLKHDGKLFSSKEIFKERASRINTYLEEWGTKAFTTPSMIRNHEWMHDLNVDFCVSSFDTDPFEPQSDGAGTIFPYWVQRDSSVHGFLELPYTLVQDFTLFVILREGSIIYWKQKLDWIAAHGGMALLNSHPDYMKFEGSISSYEEYPIAFYAEFLDYIKSRHANKFWHALPQNVWNHCAACLNPINYGCRGKQVEDRLLATAETAVRLI
jgi:hypothetical protein